MARISVMVEGDTLQELQAALHDAGARFDAELGALATPPVDATDEAILDLGRALREASGQYTNQLAWFVVGSIAGGSVPTSQAFKELVGRPGPDGRWIGGVMGGINDLFRRRLGVTIVSKYGAGGEVIGWELPMDLAKQMVKLVPPTVQQSSIAG